MDLETIVFSSDGTLSAIAMILAGQISVLILRLGATIDAFRTKQFWWGTAVLLLPLCDVVHVIRYWPETKQIGIWAGLFFLICIGLFGVRSLYNW